MNECRTVRDLLALRPDGWTIVERRLVETHLETCPDCADLAHVYARQDRLIRAAPRLRLTPSQRGQFLSRIRRERRRHEMNKKLAAVFGTTAAVAALVALALGLNLLFQGESQPTISLPAPSDVASPVASRVEMSPDEVRDAVQPGTARAPSLSPFIHVFQEGDTILDIAALYGVNVISLMEANGYIDEALLKVGQELIVPQLVFAGEIRLEQTVGELANQISSFAWTDPNSPYRYGVNFAPVRLNSPTYEHFSFNWRVLSPPSVDWRVFVHLMNESGELVLQSDVAVDWPEGPCPEYKSDPQCMATSEHDWEFPVSFPPGLYTVTVGLYDPETGERASVTSPTGATYPVVLRQVKVLPDEAASTEVRTPPPPYIHAVQEGETLLSIATRFGVSVEALLAANDIKDPSWLQVGQMLSIPGEQAKREFAIYLVEQDISQLDLSKLQLDGPPILTLDDIVSYNWETHAMTLTATAYERLARLQVPVAPGLPFVVYAGGEPIYRGAFWTLASSATFDGIVITAPPAVGEPLCIQLGYPSTEFYTGADLRADPRIFQALEAAGKTSEPVFPPPLAAGVPFTVCQSSETWTRPSEEEQAAQVWDAPRRQSIPRETLRWFFQQSFYRYGGGNSEAFDVWPELGLWTASEAPFVCEGNRIEDIVTGRRIEVWVLLHRVLAAQRQGNVYTITVEPAASGYQIVHLPGPGPVTPIEARSPLAPAILRFVDAEGREVDRLPKYPPSADSVTPTPVPPPTAAPVPRPSLTPTAVAPAGGAVVNIFASWESGNSEIYVEYADGAVVNVTNHPGGDAYPDLSPDGKRIVFASNRDGESHIFVMNVDGSGVTRLTDSVSGDTLPVWSPDGTRIAFQSLRDGNWEIYGMMADGSGQTNLTNHPARDLSPAWSPDGSQIYFETDRDGNLYDPYVMNADGSGQTRAQ
jgi:LysM repeat protein